MKYAHRDIKSKNVLPVARCVTAFAKLGDFGLALNTERAGLNGIAAIPATDQNTLTGSTGRLLRLARFKNRNTNRIRTFE
jgi:hypothetical protein